MHHIAGLIVLSALFLGASSARLFGAEPLSVGNDPLPVGGLMAFAGAWTVQFSNGVMENATIDVGGAASVIEPLRSSPGRIAAAGPGFGDSFIIAFDDDRTERWTKVGERMVVEHWCPSAAFPSGDRVLGIAEPAEKYIGVDGLVARHDIKLPTGAHYSLLIYHLPQSIPHTYRIEVCLGEASPTGERNVIQSEVFRNGYRLSEADAVQIADTNGDQFPEIRVVAEAAGDYRTYRQWVYDRTGARFVAPPAEDK
jgi:hypothetical protein